MSEVPPAIRDVYDPERLRSDGHRLIDALADQLASWQSREGIVVPWKGPDQALADWDDLSDRGGGELVTDLLRIARASTALANPQCMGHQVPPPLPSGVLAETVSALINNGMAVAEMGPAAVPIELAVIRWMCGKLGMPEGAGGVLTSGGSLGNLTALLAMRQVKAGFDLWKDGAHGGPPLAVIVSEEAHYSIARALRVMGWGDGGAIAVPIDADHQMIPAAAEAAIRDAKDRKIIGIVAAAGSTATGAFDPLDELAAIARRHDLWLHVDAAHGGGVAVSDRQRHKLRGIEHADSIVWDAHKLLMMPAMVTAVIYRREADVYAAFAQQASYLFADAHPENTWWDLGQRALECTKRAMAAELYVTLRAYGVDVLAEIVDRQHALAIALADRVAAAADFELAVAPASNIVCYRHRPVGMPVAQLDAHNRALRARAVADGRFYIVGTQLQQGYFLRSALMNPLIETRDLDALLDHLRGLCRG